MPESVTYVPGTTCNLSALKGTHQRFGGRYSTLRPDLHDVLDAITLIHYKMIERYHDRGVANQWRQFVGRVFKESNVAYTVDDKGGVHPLVDQEFARNIATAIAGLGLPRYEMARRAFEAADTKLKQLRLDAKGAIRDTFEAAETLTKLI